MAAHDVKVVHLSNRQFLLYKESPAAIVEVCSLSIATGKHILILADSSF